jgi:hypothetical protein
VVIVWIMVGALLILGHWALILWLGGRADAKHLERERINRVFGDSRDG